MALTNFAALTQEQLTLWQRDVWKQARNHSFITRFMGEGPNSLFQRITQLKKDQKGSRAVITLLADLVGDGVAGDRQLEGNEEAMQTFDQVIRIDQLRHGTRHLGRMADQKSVVEFRKNAKDVLSYWQADRHDQLAFLTLSGVPYSTHNNGAPRVGSDFPSLEYAADVKPLSAYRRLRWNRGGGSITAATLDSNAATTSVAAVDTPCWEMFIQLKAYAKTHKIRGVKINGEETYHAFLSPMAMAKLKLDPTYLQNLRHATSKGVNDKLYSGATVKIDGIYLHEFRHVPNTRMAAAGSKFGNLGAVDGCQMLFCGAQALAMADIGNPKWVEKEFDYDNAPGISVSKILGFLKPQFETQYSGGSVEDHGIISAFVAQ